MRKNEEYNLALAVSKYLRLQYPSVIFRFDMAGLNLSKTQAGMNKAIQHSRAYPDLFILKPRKIQGIQYHGLFLELKKEGTKLYKKDGRPTSEHLTEQANILLRLSENGYCAYFSVGFDQTKELIDRYLKGS